MDPDADPATDHAEAEPRPSGLAELQQLVVEPQWSWSKGADEHSRRSTGGRPSKSSFSGVTGGFNCWATRVKHLDHETLKFILFCSRITWTIMDPERNSAH